MNSYPQPRISCPYTLIFPCIWLNFPCPQRWRSILISGSIFRCLSTPTVRLYFLVLARHNFTFCNLHLLFLSFHCAPESVFSVTTNLRKILFDHPITFSPSFLWAEQSSSISLSSCIPYLNTLKLFGGLCWMCFSLHTEHSTTSAPPLSWKTSGGPFQPQVFPNSLVVGSRLP